MKFTSFIFTLISIFLLPLGAVACGAGSDDPPRPSPTAPAVVTATPPPPVNPTRAPQLATTPPAPLATSRPTDAPGATPTLNPTIFATPKPLHPYSIAGLRDIPPHGENFQSVEILEQDAAVIHGAITYESDGLTITGRMHQPVGEGPYPVIILIHGFMPRDTYWSGWGTWQSADYFARRGYIAIAPDLRSWGGSDSGISLFQTGLVRDVINLIAVLPSLPTADPSKVGLWGHSMGGGIATKVAMVSSQVDAAVLYAPNSADDADLIARWGAACRPGQEPQAGCNPSEILPADLNQIVIDAYYAAATRGIMIEDIAPIYHLDELTVPLQIHIGTEDGQALSGTPPEWSAKLAAGLETAGRPHEYFVYEGEGHFFEGESWVLMMERSLTLFEQQLR